MRSSSFESLLKNNFHGTMIFSEQCGSRVPEQKFKAAIVRLLSKELLSVLVCHALVTGHTEHCKNEDVSRVSAGLLSVSHDGILALRDRGYEPEEPEVCKVALTAGPRLHWTVHPGRGPIFSTRGRFLEGSGSEWSY